MRAIIIETHKKTDQIADIGLFMYKHIYIYSNA